MEYCICLYCMCMGAGGWLRGKGDACNQSCPCTRIAFPFLAWHAHVHSHALTLMHGARVWACTKLIVDASNRIRPCAIVLGVTPSCVGWIHPCMMDPGGEGGGCPLNACVHSSCALSWMHRIGDAWWHIASCTMLWQMNPSCTDGCICAWGMHEEYPYDWNHMHYIETHTHTYSGVYVYTHQAWSIGWTFQDGQCADMGVGGAYC